MMFEDQAARILDSISFFGSGTEKQADRQRADAEDAIAAALRAERERALEEAAKVCYEKATSLGAEAETHQRKSAEWQRLGEDADLADSLADAILALKETP